MCDAVAAHVIFQANPDIAVDHTYVKYRPDLEIVSGDESELIEQIVAHMARTNEVNSRRAGKGIRDAHTKSHGFLKGELVVREGLPQHLAQGIFTRPATYPVVLRLSSAPGVIHGDTIPVARGMAIKVIGTEGERLLASDTGRNQDFLLVNIPVLTFGTVRKYKDLLDLLEANVNSPDVVQKAIAAAARAAASVIGAGGGTPGSLVQGLARSNSHLLGETYYSMSAYRFGDYMAKISIAPLSENVRALSGRVVRNVGPSTFRDLVVEHFWAEGAEYEVRAQLCSDIYRMPIEDASILWPEGMSPHQAVAILRIPPQDAYSIDRQAYFEDVLSFNPWHGIVEHQPLGSINRIRIKAYERSSNFRHVANRTPRIEPESIGEIPD